MKLNLLSLAISISGKLRDEVKFKIKSQFLQILGGFTLSCQLSYLQFRDFERKDHTLLDAQDLSRLPVNHALDLSRTGVMGLG